MHNNVSLCKMTTTSQPITTALSCNPNESFLLLVQYLHRNYPKTTLLPPVLSDYEMKHSSGILLHESLSIFLQLSTKPKRIFLLLTSHTTTSTEIHITPMIHNTIPIHSGKFLWKSKCDAMDYKVLWEIRLERDWRTCCSGVLLLRRDDDL